MAIRYLCPICDHELVARGFCSSCKKFIKEPVEYKGAYLPNEDRGNYTLNRNMTEKERRSSNNYKYHTVQRNTGTTNSSGSSYTDSGRTNTLPTSARTYTTANRANTATTAGRANTTTTANRANTSSTVGRTYTTSSRTNTSTRTGRINTDYGNCGGHKDSDYGVPNVDPHSEKKKKKGGFKYAALIYIIIVILKIIFDSIG